MRPYPLHTLHSQAITPSPMEPAHTAPARWLRHPSRLVPGSVAAALGLLGCLVTLTPALAQCDGPSQFLPMQGVDRGAQTIALLPSGDVVVNLGAHNSDAQQFSTASRAAGGVPMGAVAGYRPRAVYPPVTHGTTGISLPRDKARLSQESAPELR